MLRKLLTKNWKYKVTSVCYGLITVSIALLLIYFVGLDKIFNINIILDNYFFGFKTELFFVIYHLINILVLSAVIYSLQRETILGISLGIFWVLFNLLETIFDIPIFSFDPGMVFEEILFLLIYLFLFIVLFVNYFYTTKVFVSVRRNGVEPLARRVTTERGAEDIV